tara:strand:+ start:6330 stop:7580 length:1251 start_codon:yes stop_codon:yes gene_type:complete
MILTREYRDRWSAVAKTIFRLLFLYSTLYIFMTFFGQAFGGLMRWFAETVLHWGADFSTTPTGSGDTTFHYVQWFFTLFFSLLGTVIWAIFDRKRAAYNQLAYWFRVLLRYYLFFFMMTYGFVKVFKTQFADIQLSKLLQPIGELSPMGLAWTYMGHSVAYNVFVGLAEIIGGLLLLSRRTQTLGAFIVIGVMGHVAMMNFTYDIPVKLFSVHLVFFAFLLLLTDIERFTHVFFLNKATTAISEPIPSTDTTYTWVIRGLKLFTLLIVIGMFTFQSTTVMNTRSTGKIAAPFYGIWEVRTMVKNNDTLPPLKGDEYRWNYVILEHKRRALTITMSDVRKQYYTRLDTVQRRFGWHASEKDSIPFNFSYQFLGSDALQLEGVLETDTLSVLLVRKNIEDFELMSRKFHWINENPHNR